MTHPTEAARLADIIEKDLPKMGESESAWCSVRGYDLRAIHSILRSLSAPAADVPMPEPAGYIERWPIYRDPYYTADQTKAYGDARERAAIADCSPYLKDGETPAQCIERHRREVDAVLSLLVKEREKQDKWRLAMDEAFATHHLGTCEPDDDPRAKLNELLAWHADIALDPNANGSSSMP